MRTFFGATALAVMLSCAACQNTPPLEIPGMVYIQPGKAKMGYAQGRPNEKPEREVDITRGFHIDKTEVTNEDYAKFLGATKRNPPPHWKDGKFGEGEAKFPVTQVTWDDAKAYADWAEKQLPSEQQWEYAARGPEGRLYPWGNDWATGRANNFEAAKNGPVEVGTFKEGASPFGLLDMAGNVWEWTNTPGNKSGEYVIKGGSYAPLEDRPRSSLKGSVAKEQAKENLGFRCVKEE